MTTTQNTPVRKWRMIRLDAGDYLLPSNDRSTVFRIRRYTDGPSAGLNLPRDRDFWGVWRLVGSMEAFNGDDLEMWPEGWVQIADMLDKRQEAIDAALRWEYERDHPRPKPEPRNLGGRGIGAVLAEGFASSPTKEPSND